MTSGSNAIPVWWQMMRDTLSQAENILAALIAALVGRTIAMEIARAAMVNDAIQKPEYSYIMICLQQEAQMSGSTDSSSIDLSEWESVTMDREAWTVLIRQLEDLLCLSCLLAQKSPSSPAKGDAESTVKTSPEPIKVCVKKVMDGGKG